MYIKKKTWINNIQGNLKEKNIKIINWLLTIKNECKLILKQLNLHL